jgi:preprotein translocase subunit SecY
MKKTIISGLFLLFGVTVFAQEKQAEIKFAETSHDFGSIVEGAQATYEFSFTNTGNVPLVLSSVNASCGCTTPQWTKDPIAPGQTGKITAVFNSSGKGGPFSKSITVHSNAKSGSIVLTIKGNVEPKQVEPASPVQNPNK